MMQSSLELEERNQLPNTQTPRGQTKQTEQSTPTDSVTGWVVHRDEKQDRKRDRREWKDGRRHDVPTMSQRELRVPGQRLRKRSARRLMFELYISVGVHPSVHGTQTHPLCVLRNVFRGTVHVVGSHQRPFAISLVGRNKGNGTRYSIMIKTSTKSSCSN